LRAYRPPTEDEAEHTHRFTKRQPPFSRIIASNYSFYVHPQNAAFKPPNDEQILASHPPFFSIVFIQDVKQPFNILGESDRYRAKQLIMGISLQTKDRSGFIGFDDSINTKPDLNDRGTLKKGNQMNQINSSWLELNTHQPEDAISFYKKTLGWAFEPTDLPQGGAYWIARHNDKPVGGVFALNNTDPTQIPSHWMTYMHVSDIDEATSSARKAGGEIIRPAMSLDGIGKLAIITDSTGALIGLIEPESLGKNTPAERPTNNVPH